MRCIRVAAGDKGASANSILYQISFDMAEYFTATLLRRHATRHLADRLQRNSSPSLSAPARLDYVICSNFLLWARVCERALSVSFISLVGTPGRLLYYIYTGRTFSEMENDFGHRRKNRCNFHAPRFTWRAITETLIYIFTTALIQKKLKA